MAAQLCMYWSSQKPCTLLYISVQTVKGGLTSEEEQTADQLLADIQSAVDEMLNDFQANNLSPDATPQPPLNTSSTASVDKV